MRVDWEVKTEWFVKEKQKGRTRREHAWCKDDGTFYKIKMEQRRLKMTKTKTQARWKDVLKEGHFKEGKEKEKQQQ